jgi:hypothetical protein
VEGRKGGQIADAGRWFPGWEAGDLTVGVGREAWEASWELGRVSD